MRKEIFSVLFAGLGVALLLGLIWAPFYWVAVAFGGLVLLGIHDLTQTRRTILRNFPVLGHGRYLLELIRPEINQYFIESNTDGTPFNREQRSVIYQRAKKQLDTTPFGTQSDVYAPGYEWIAHSFMACKPEPGEFPRVLIGEGACSQPYAASLLNISAMSFGSLSSRAVEALNKGAAAGGFAHNTGEGGVSPYHLKHGGDLIWQVGTGYFACRDDEGKFDPDCFAKTAANPAIKMIEIKLSQGAKPGHGGILPARKVTAEIAEIRGVKLGQDVLSPPSHSTFDTPHGLLDWITQLRQLSGGKPIGIKLCVGLRSEFMALCKAMRSGRKYPDYIVVDGGEGGTGAAPLEFANSVGMPLNEGLAFVQNCLVGFDLRQRVRVIASGKITSGFDMLRMLALGADACYSARAMMMSIGCIQARRCHANDCPVGVATQNAALMQGLDVEDKAERANNYQHETVESLMELLGAAGLKDPTEVTPRHIQRRVDESHSASYFDLYPFIERGSLISEPVPEAYEISWHRASASRF
ncbi:MAG: glutamate synthase domain-containing protein 2 [Planctomycetota bacterium]|jgi:glutamate synthase domain-containing protein 2